LKRQLLFLNLKEKKEGGLIMREGGNVQNRKGKVYPQKKKKNLRIPNEKGTTMGHPEPKKNQLWFLEKKKENRKGNGCAGDQNKGGKGV